MTALTTRRFAVPTAASMRELGSAVGRACSGGDVIVLTGELGAGKTTFTQGVAQGLGIDEAVTSPTFVIARVHRHASGGHDLVHVDAYRLGSALELDDLDLEADLDTSVVVVEWGGGLAEHLSPTLLDVDIDRSDHEDDEERTVTLAARGTGWSARLGDDAAWPT